jgi:hypothetical protein
MSEYTSETKLKKDGSVSVRYREDNKFVKATEVPEDVKTALGDLDDGVAVDENGLVVEQSEQNNEPAKGIPSPETPKALDKAAEAGARPDVKLDKPEPETRREDELPGGSQEPVVANPVINIDSADDVDDESGLDVEEQDRAARTKAALEGDEEGMGFPRKNGKTVDIFDGKTPHTHVRYVASIMVPVSEENYRTKSDGEIIDKLRKLGKI